MVRDVKEEEMRGGGDKGMQNNKIFQRRNKWRQMDHRWRNGDNSINNE